MSRHPLLLAGCLVASVPLVLGAGAVPPAAAGASDFLKVSRATGGADLNGVAYDADISADGRWITYDTGASNVGANDTNGSFDVALFDAKTKKTRLVSRGTGTGNSMGATVADDGGRVAFVSNDDDLAPGDDDAQRNVLVWSRSGDKIRRVDVDVSGGDPNGAATEAAISADGRWVAFLSFATDLTAKNVNPGNVHLYLRDLVKHRTTVLDPKAGSTAQSVSIDAHGKHVAYLSSSQGLASGGASGTGSNVLVFRPGHKKARDLTPIDGNGNEVSISADGTRVAFDYTGALVPGDVDGANDVYLRDLGQPKPRLVTGTADMVSGAAISPDGGYIAFNTPDALHSGDDNAVTDTYRWKARNSSFSRINENADASSLDAELSRAGRYAAYESEDLDFFPSDDNGFTDIYRRRFTS